MNPNQNKIDYSHVPLWIFISIQFVLLVVITLFFTLLWEHNILNKVNAVLWQQTDDINEIVAHNNEYVDGQVQRVFDEFGTPEPTATPRPVFIPEPEPETEDVSTPIE